MNAAIAAARGREGCKDRLDGGAAVAYMCTVNMWTIHLTCRALPMPITGRPETTDAWRLLPLTDLSYQILLALGGAPLHGYAILQTIAARTGGRIEPESGTLYTAIRRLRRDGLIDEATEADGADAAPTDARRGRSYGLTELGREVLALESRRLAELVDEARARQVLPARGAARGS